MLRKQDQLLTTKEWLAFSASTIRAAKTDQEHIRTYGQIIYNLDFNLLAPILADAAPVGAPPFQQENLDNYRHLLSVIDSKEPVKLTISEPTVLEVMDLLLHNHKHFSVLQGRVNELENALDKQIPVSDSEMIEREIKDILKRTPFTEANKRTSTTLLDLLHAKKLTGLGDWIDKKAIMQERRLFSKFTEIYERQYAVRSARDSRQEQDKVFHYKVDALNVCLTLATSSNKPQQTSFFVSATGLNTNLCVLQNRAFGRKPLVPIFVRNAARIDGINSRESVLEDADSFVKHLIQMIARADRMNDRILSQLGDLKSTFLDPLSGASEVANNNRGGTSPRFSADTTQAFRQSVDAERQSIREGASDIASTISSKADYLERFQIFEDPIVIQIEKELGVKLSSTTGGDRVE